MCEYLVACRKLVRKMGKENTKRVRGGGGGGGKNKDLFLQKTLKKQSQDRHYVVVESQDDNYLALGVFDFPWLHDDDGIISKSDSDEWKFEDTFSTSLDDIKFAGQLQWQQQYLYEIMTITTNLNMNMEMNFPDTDFEWPFKCDELEIGTMDCCIWSSMIN